MSFYDKTVNGLTLHTSTLLEALGVSHGFTTRAGGVSQGIYASLNLGGNRGDDPARVEENYRRVCDALEVDRTKLAFSRQVHRDTVRVVTAADLARSPVEAPDYEADGLVTQIPGVTLVVFGADCLTALLCDPVRRVVGAFHAGWRGTAANIAGRTVEVMVNQFGCRPGHIRAAIGPCISRCCFETGEDVPQAMTAALGARATPFLTHDGAGRYHVDLKGLNTLELELAGVEAGHIDRSADCTLCKPDKYFSHRYTKGERGSQASLICLPEVGR